MNYKKIIKILILIDIFLILPVFYFLDGMWLKWIVNSQVAYLGGLIVIFASFSGINEKIQAYISTLDSENKIIEDEGEDDFGVEKENKSKKRKLIMDFNMSFLKIISYLLFVMAILMIKHFGLFWILPFSIGLITFPLAILLSMSFVLKD